MLSGGERALTAVSLLLAMLEVRPVPFCVLDEVDAALDEANVGRFSHGAALPRRADQFIVITHNRGTIEGADALYGMTARRRCGQPGRLAAASARRRPTAAAGASSRQRRQSPESRAILEHAWRRRASRSSGGCAASWVATPDDETWEEIEEILISADMGAGSPSACREGARARTDMARSALQE